MIRAPLSPATALEHLTRDLVECCRPERVALFGCRARGDAHEGSDWDILVVLDTELPDRERTDLVRVADAGR